MTSGSHLLRTGDQSLRELCDTHSLMRAINARAVAPDTISELCCARSRATSCSQRSRRRPIHAGRRNQQRQQSTSFIATEKPMLINSPVSAGRSVAVRQ